MGFPTIFTFERYFTLKTIETIKIESCFYESFFNEIHYNWMEFKANH